MMVKFKSIFGFLALVTFLVGFVLCMLKEYEVPFIHLVSWSQLLIPLVATLVLSLLFYFAASKTRSVSGSFRAGANEDQKLIFELNAQHIILYQEADLFRAMLFSAAYVLQIVVCFMAYSVPCDSCSLAINQISLGLGFVYLARLACIVYRAYARHDALLLMVREVNFYQIFRKDKRFFKDFLRDVKEDLDTTALKVTWWIHNSLLLVTCGFVVFCLYMLPCHIVCPETFATVHSFLLGAYGIEPMYIITGLLMYLYSGCSGAGAIADMSLRGDFVKKTDDNAGHLEHNGLLGDR